MSILILFSPSAPLRRETSGWVGVWPLARVNLPHQYMWLRTIFWLTRSTFLFFWTFCILHFCFSPLTGCSCCLSFFLGGKKKGKKKKKKKTKKAAGQLKSRAENTTRSTKYLILTKYSPILKHYFFTYYKTSPVVEKIYSYINPRILVLGNGSH